MNNITSKIVHFAGKAKLWAIKNKSDILFVAGIGAGIATTITACSATLKVHELTKKKESDMQLIDYALENPDDFVQEYPAEQADIDRDICTKQYIINTTKAVALPAALGFSSLGFLLASHLNMKKTAAAMAASAVAAGAKLAKYENFIEKEFGPEKKLEILSDAKEVVVDKVVATVDGNEVVEQEKITAVTVDNNPDVYVLSTETSEVMRNMSSYIVGKGEYAEVDDDDVISKVNYLSSYLNEKLKAQEYLLKNDILETFGLPTEVRGFTDGLLCGRYKTEGIPDSLEMNLEKRIVEKISPNTGIPYYEEEWIIMPNATSNIIAYLYKNSDNGKV